MQVVQRCVSYCRDLVGYLWSAYSWISIQSKIMDKSGSPNGSHLPSGGSEIDQLFKLLDDFCSNEQLRHLLRVYRPTEKDYSLSVNRDQLKRNVRRLFDSGHLPRPQLEKILERAEENGRQHIYLYVPSSEAVAKQLNNYHAMEAALLNGRTRDSAGLPKFRIRPEKVSIADMREEVREDTKYSTWIFKLYVGIERWRPAGRPEINGDEKVVRYKLRYSREVLLVKWHSFGLLEVRIPVGRSRQEQMAARQHLILTINNAVAAADEMDSDAGSLDELAKHFDIDTRNKRLNVIDVETSKLLAPFNVPVKELDGAARSGAIKWISVNETDYDVDGHTFTVSADDAREDLYQNPKVASALQNVEDCKRLNALIHVREQPDYLEKLAVEFCPAWPHEIRIGSETSPEVIEFIIRRVWEYAEGTSKLPESPVDMIVSSNKEERSELSTLTFNGLAQAHPYFANALIRLHQWVAEHPSAEFLDPRRLQKELGTGLHTPELAVAVAKLVEDGLLERKYRIKPANKRKYLPQVFDSVEDILDAKIEDENGDAVDVSEASIVPVYGKAGMSDQ